MKREARTSPACHFRWLSEDLILIELESEGACCGAESSGLSEAEHAVAWLAAEGHSNEEIARRRGSTSRTVANQLGEVYRKLGISGRRELGAWLRRPEAGVA
jgi:DNA-binding CsgD family transcriptional regulator